MVRMRKLYKFNGRYTDSPVELERVSIEDILYVSELVVTFFKELFGFIKSRKVPLFIVKNTTRYYLMVQYGDEGVSSSYTNALGQSLFQASGVDERDSKKSLYRILKTQGVV